MKRIVMAVFLSLIGPGLGQIYNRDFKKGFILLAIAFALFIAPFVWIVRMAGPELMANPTMPLTPERVQAIVEQVIRGNGHVLNLISLAFLGVWAYAITQAYFKAKFLNEKEKEIINE